MTSIGFVKSHFELLIKHVEGDLKTLDQMSLLFAIFSSGIIIYIMGFPSSFSTIGSYGQMVGLPSMVVFLQAFIKSVLYYSGQSLISNHIECISLLEKVKFTMGEEWISTKKFWLSHSQPKPTPPSTATQETSLPQSPDFPQKPSPYIAPYSKLTQTP